MKLVRYGPPGREKPGLIDADGVLRDLSRKVKDIDGDALAPVVAVGPSQAGRAAAACGQGPAAARPVHRDALEVRRDRTQLQRPREGNGLADPGESGRVLQVADVHRRRERQHHACRRTRRSSTGKSSSASSSAVPRGM